jgi:hypothetical protein
MFKRKQEIIEFYKDPELDIKYLPKRATKYLPEYFKTLKKGDNDNNITAKNCVPFIDAMSLGYTIPLWCSYKIVISEHFKAYDKDGNLLEDNYPIMEYPLGRRPAEGLTYGGGVVDSYEPIGLGMWYLPSSGERPEGHPLWQLNGFRFTNNAPNKMVAKAMSPWSIKTPKGWSVLIKNVSNNYENDITIFEAVIDTDTYNYNINFPFFWTGTKKGIFDIDAGTPFAQVIPFKRSDSIKHIVSDRKPKSFYYSHFLDTYKKVFWHKRKNPE